MWDKRATSLKTQVALPLTNSLEMGNVSVQQVADRLNRNSHYRKWFKSVFDSEATPDNLAEAIAAFERCLVAFNAPIDRHLAGDDNALTDEAKAGFVVFKQLDCIECHKPPMWRDDRMHNTGVNFFYNEADFGLRSVSGREADTGKFKTPTLRLLKYTAPYFHNGRAETIEEVVDLYVRGFARNGRVDAFHDERVAPRRVSAAQRSNLITFLKEAFQTDDYPYLDPPNKP
jgi:cytochrome c peroxidase